MWKCANSHCLCMLKADSVKTCNMLLSCTTNIFHNWDFRLAHALTFSCLMIVLIRPVGKDLQAPNSDFIFSLWMKTYQDTITTFTEIWRRENCYFFHWKQPQSFFLFSLWIDLLLFCDVCISTPQALRPAFHKRWVWGYKCVCAQQFLYMLYAQSRDRHSKSAQVLTWMNYRVPASCPDWVWNPRTWFHWTTHAAPWPLGCVPCYC